MHRHRAGHRTGHKGGIVEAQRGGTGDAQGGYRGGTEEAHERHKGGTGGGTGETKGRQRGDTALGPHMGTRYRHRGDAHYCTVQATARPGLRFGLSCGLRMHAHSSEGCMLSRGDAGRCSQAQGCIHACGDMAGGCT